MRASGLLLAVSLTALSIVPTSLCAGETVVYVYDDLGRLIKTTQTGTINNGVETDLAYDRAGNRTDYDVTGSNGAGDPGGTGATGGGNGSGGSGGGGETPPSFSVNDASGTEGGSLTFTITKSGTVSNSYSVNYATADSSAIAGSDYTAISGTATFTGSETAKTMVINTINDSAPENTEVFHFDLTASGDGSTISDPQGAGTINDDGDSANQPPNTAADYLSMQVCSTDTIDVVANDPDPEGNYPVSLVSEDHGQASIINSTTIEFISFAAPATYTVNYVVQDSLGAQSTGQLYVTVNGGSCF